MRPLDRINAIKFSVLGYNLISSTISKTGNGGSLTRMQIDNINPLLRQWLQKARF
jgi:hypothetical protein